MSTGRSENTVKGTYVLLFQVVRPQVLRVGALGDIAFVAGHYAYVGSAQGGLEARIRHHLRESKRKHWHIDYVLPSALLRAVWYEVGGKRECEVAAALEERCTSVPGFGCSDCRCPSHLFFAPRRQRVETVLSSLGLTRMAISGQNCETFIVNEGIIRRLRAD